MKNLYIIIISTCFLFCGKANAQEAYEKGDITINAGISFGTIGYGFGYGAAGFPIPLTASVDYGLTDLISVGPYAGYMSRTYGLGSDLRFTSLSFGGQGAIHLSPLLNELDLDINTQKVDYYGKLILGYETYSWSYDNLSAFSDYYSGRSGRVVFGPVLGVRYMFKSNFGAYAEGGRGAFGYLNLGLSVRL